MVGLDIEAIAIELAQREVGEGSNIPPTQILPVTEEDRMSSNTARRGARSISANSHTSTPNVPLGEIR
jgi:hypothetical protein